MNFKKVKWLIPVLAILVILESVLIVQKITKRTSEDLSTETTVPAILEEEKEALITFSGEEAVKINEESEVSVIMTPFKNVSLDGVDILIEYDPDYLEVLGIIPSDRFSYVARNWIEPEKKRVLVSLLETELPEGISFEAGDEVNLVTIQYSAKQPGRTGLKIIGGEGEAGTVLAENTTAEKVLFLTEDFTITVE